MTDVGQTAPQSVHQGLFSFIAAVAKDSAKHTSTVMSPEHISASEVGGCVGPELVLSHEDELGFKGRTMSYV